MAEEVTYPMAAPSDPSCDLFISHAKGDEGWVNGYLAGALKQAGVCIRSEATFALGAPRLLEFERAVQDCRRILLILSPAYLGDAYNQFIDLLAQHYGLEKSQWPVIPLILHPVDLPLSLRMLMPLEATDPDQWPRVIERLCVELKTSPPGPPPKPLCPYPGMRPFHEADSTRFFGRNQDIEELLQHLRLHRFRTVIGPSGSGKSSLVFAGLIPALRGSSLFGPGDWLVHSTRPGETPLSTLEAMLGGDVRNPPQMVTDALARHNHARRLLLVIDQFEEVFTLADPEAATSFQQVLLRLVAVPACYVIVTVRADFYPELMVSPLWPEIRSHRQEVVPLDEAGLREAILNPAKAVFIEGSFKTVDVFIETTLVERLLADAAGEPGILPLVQDTLVLLWEKLERYFLPFRAYEMLVLSYQPYRDPRGKQHTALQVAMANRADAVLGALDDQQQVIARRIFLRLIQFGEGRADTRRQQADAALQAVNDDPDLFDHTLGHLIDSRLLTSSGEGEEKGTRKVDIAHEALIGGWPALQDWITKRRVAEQTRRRLTDKASEWKRLGKGDAGLLDEVQVMEADQWLHSFDAAELGYDEDLPALVKASQKALEETRKAIEETRKVIEEAKRKAIEEAKRRRRRFIQFGAVSLALLVIIAIQSIHSRFNQINALNESSSYLFVENSKLDALVAAVRAGQLQEDGNRWQRHVPGFDRFFTEAADIRIKTIGTLQQTVYGTHERNRLTDHSEKVNSVSYHPKGHMLASGSDDHTIRLWKADGELINTINVHERVTSIAFSPVSAVLAAAYADGAAHLWDPVDPVNVIPLRRWQGHQGGPTTGWITHICFNPSGDVLATAGRDHTITLWNVANRERVRELRGHEGWVNGVSFSPNGAILASAGEDGTVRLWNVKKGTEIQPLRDGKRVTSLTFSPDDRFLASAHEDPDKQANSIIVWDMLDRAPPTRLMGHTATITSVRFSPDSKLLVSASEDNSLRIWRRADDNWALLTTLRGHIGEVLSADFSPDGKVLVSSGTDRTIRLWRIPIVSAFVDMTIYSAGLSPDGKTVAASGLTASKEPFTQLCHQDKAASKLLCRPPKVHESSVQAISFSPDGRILASGHEDGTIQLWNSHDGTPLMSLDGKQRHNDVVNSISFHPSGKVLASGSDYKTVRLWKSDNGAWKDSPLQGHQAGISSVVFSPDGKTLVSGSYDHTVKLWQLDEPLLKASLWKTLDQQEEVTSLRFSPDAKTLAVANKNRIIKLWRIEDATLRQTIQGYQGGVEGLSFGPEGDTLVSGSRDNRMMFWDPDAGTWLKTLERDPDHREAVHSISFSNDGKALMSASNKTGVLLWSFDLGGLLARGCEQLHDYLKTHPQEEQLCGSSKSH